MDWKTFWNTFPDRFPDDAFLEQVGKTYRGQPISREQLGMVISSITRTLEINRDDLVLDLCCGNGLITAAVARSCGRIVGVDFSRPLIAIANRFHGMSNVSYFEESALDITLESLHVPDRFSKIYMYDGLQHFEEEELAPLLNTLRPLLSKGAAMLFAGIPDQDRAARFDSTPGFVNDFRRRARDGSLSLGTWWKKEFIQTTCRECGFQADVFAQETGLHTAHYRFDVRITKP